MKVKGPKNSWSLSVLYGKSILKKGAKHMQELIGDKNNIFK